MFTVFAKNVFNFKRFFVPPYVTVIYRLRAYHRSDKMTDLGPPDSVITVNEKDGATSSPDEPSLPSLPHYFRAPHLAENDRQRQVEAESRDKVIALKASLVALGEEHGIRYITYGGEEHLHEIMDLITRDLSEPYSIYTYRYFIYQWPKLCHLVSVIGKSALDISIVTLTVSHVCTFVLLFT